MQPEFKEFPKMARFSRDIVISEKIDGMNTCIHFEENGDMFTGSRSGWITIDADICGFAKWAQDNKVELSKLGPGTHFGEWWGSGVRRSYDLVKGEKRFSLFNTRRWADELLRPSCCLLVPILWKGNFDEAISKNIISLTIEALKVGGSYASPGFMNPEGIVIFHEASNLCFKKTIEKDETPKSLVK
jgi:hypothetical protein